ncbi:MULTISPECIES: MBL fold metallo-hydrolase [unclassified Modestobacter]
MSGISTAVVVGDRFYLVDAGHGVLRQLRRSGLGSPAPVGPLDALAAVFLTHLHSDHVADLAALLTAGLFNGLGRVPDVVPIWGPGRRGALEPLTGTGAPPAVVAPENPGPGTADMVQLLVRAFAADFNNRARDNRVPTPDALFAGRDVPLPAEYAADPNGAPHPRMSPFPVHEDDRVRVTATLVQHAPVFPAFAYRFDTDDGSVVVSGDTSPSENLVELARDTDLLLHEVISRSAIEANFPEPRTPATEAVLQHVLGAHTTVEDVGAVAERAGAAALVLHHRVPIDLLDEQWAAAQQGYRGRVHVAHDLDVFTVGSTAR